MKKHAEPATEQVVSSDDDSQNSVKLLTASTAPAGLSTAAQSTLLESAASQIGGERVSQSIFYAKQQQPSPAAE